MIHCTDDSFPVKRQTTIVTYDDSSTSAILIDGSLDSADVPRKTHAIAVDIGESVTSIASSAFSGCMKLQSVTS